jgi:L-threonylcarbamoyladenylate synthase
MSNIGKDINKAIAHLKNGDLVAIPTETVYGLAGNGTDPRVVAEIFRVKNRPSFDPMILHFDGLASIERYVKVIPEKAVQLAQQFWPGPLTLLLYKSELVPDLVTAGSPKVAVRVPSHPLTQELLANLDFPLAAPSANIFGYISPTRADHVADQLGDQITYILDGGQCKVGLESTILDLTTEKPGVLRKGGISIEEIEAVIGKVDVATHSTSNPTAPGMLKSHYAPSIPIVIGEVNMILESISASEIGGLFFSKAHDQLLSENQRVLSHSGDIKEAAANLFAYMRELDKTNCKIIVTELVPDIGLGRAINDKLKRASAKG